jgi:hypothetical protein
LEEGDNQRKENDCADPIKVFKQSLLPEPQTRTRSVLNNDKLQTSDSSTSSAVDINVSQGAASSGLGEPSHSLPYVHEMHQDGDSTFVISAPGVTDAKRIERGAEGTLQEQDGGVVIGLGGGDGKILSSPPVCRLPIVPLAAPGGGNERTSEEAAAMGPGSTIGVAGMTEEEGKAGTEVDAGIRRADMQGQDAQLSSILS